MSVVKVLLALLKAFSSCRKHIIAANTVDMLFSMTHAPRLYFSAVRYLLSNLLNGGTQFL